LERRCLVGGAQPGPRRRGDFLTAVSAVSPTDIWAAGEYETGGQSKTLIVQWNGTTWNQVASPSPGAGGNLVGIAANSQANAWAVGQFGAVGSDNAFAVRYCADASG
jgi:hypothetical protein